MDIAFKKYSEPKLLHIKTKNKTNLLLKPGPPVTLTFLDPSSSEVGPIDSQPSVLYCLIACLWQV